MVETLQKILGDLKKANKPVWLFAALKMDEMIDRWSIIVAAPWINSQNRNVAFKEIVDLIVSSLESTDVALIARMSLLNRDDHLVQELLKRKTGDILKDEKVNGNLIHSGVIIESNPNLVWKESESSLF